MQLQSLQAPCQVPCAMWRAGSVAQLPPCRSTPTSLPRPTCPHSRELLGDKALLSLMRKKGDKRDSKADNQEDAAFDVLTRELVFEAKARPGERTLTGARRFLSNRSRPTAAAVLHGDGWPATACGLLRAACVPVTQEGHTLPGTLPHLHACS